MTYILLIQSCFVTWIDSSICVIYFCCFCNFWSLTDALTELAKKLFVISRNNLQV